MRYNQQESLDRLRRAYEMEECLNGALLPLCQAAVADLPPEKQDRIRRLLASVQADTQRHARIVRYWIEYYGKPPKTHETL